MALDLPDSTRSALARWRDSALSGLAQVRPLPEDALHLTLVFLGATSPSSIGEVWQAATGAAAGCEAPLLAPTGLRALPPQSPRLFALALSDEDGRAARLHELVADSLAAAGLHEREHRPFWPHVTLARVRRGARTRGLTRAETRTTDVQASAAFTATTLTLYRSELTSAGARYTSLERLELGR